MYKLMSKKQKKLFKRIIITALLVIPCFIIPEKYVVARALSFAVPYLFIGYDIILKAIKNIKNGHVFDENFLMGVATVGAYSLGEFPEAVMVVLLYQIGELFQSYAVSRSRKSISELMDIRPDYANLVNENGEAVSVSPEKVNVNDIILIKSGEKIPLDCIIIEGASEVDTSSLTGESALIAVMPGDKITSGCINITGTVKARVTKAFSESTVSKILQLTQYSAEKKTKSENFITKFAKIYTPAVCILALCMAVIPTIFFGNFTTYLKSALIFLVVSCPCALIISVPLTFFCGIGCASKHGILVKGAVFIEGLSKINTVIFDKTGTLTKGKFSVSDVLCLNGYKKDEILYLTAKAEFYSTHPIAMAIKDSVKCLDADGIADSRQIVGKGIKATIDGKRVLVGNIGLMSDNGLKFPENDASATALYVSVNNQPCGIIYVKDTVKPDTVSAIKKLKALGIKKTVMLTGDKESVANDIGISVGIDEIHSELLPDEKVSIAEKIIEENTEKYKTAYVGDGINDAPVLSRADVGIAMGGLGSDAAIEAADVVIMDDMLSKIPLAVSISEKTMAIVRQNIVLSIGIKLSIMVISALGINSSMYLAIFADVGVAVIAILNALRTLKIKK